jgi:hypothetical protein
MRLFTKETRIPFIDPNSHEAPASTAGGGNAAMARSGTDTVCARSVWGGSASHCRGRLRPASVADSMA